MSTFFEHSGIFIVKAFFILAIVLCCTGMIYPQENNWQLTLNDKSEISKIQIDSCKGSSLAYILTGQTHLMEVESITEIRKVNDPNPWLWQGGGFLIGATVFLIAGLTQDSPGSSGKLESLETAGAVGLAIAGGLIGGLIGWGVSEIVITDDVYDLNGLPLNDKLKIIVTVPLN